jgi:hypothetical protein
MDAIAKGMMGRLSKRCGPIDDNLTWRLQRYVVIECADVDLESLQERLLAKPVHESLELKLRRCSGFVSQQCSKINW